MLYAIFCYNDEDVIFSWTKEQDDAVMAKLDVVHQKLARNGKLGPAVRLMPTTAATTIRKDQEPPLVLDGPFAETKEQLLGFMWSTARRSMKPSHSRGIWPAPIRGAPMRFGRFACICRGAR